MDSNGLPTFLQSLLRAEAFEHSVDDIELIETHISYVILTGSYAYKIKKSINLGFLDFSTLEKRLYYYHEELRLNARLAPEIYLGVVAIIDTEAGACIFEQETVSDSDKVIEYAVKMKQFPQQGQLDRMLDEDMLKEQHIEKLANMVARFHQQIPCSNEKDHFGEPERIYKPVKENFSQIRALPIHQKVKEQLNIIETYSNSTFEKIRPQLIQRKQDGFIRECHGDLHLRNLMYMEQQVRAFDCIEFEPEFRWIDTINDIAFLIMDLHHRKRYDFAQRILTIYLEVTGDYQGVRLLSYYLIYRAMVRAKVEAITASQLKQGSVAEKLAQKAFDDYIQLASSYLKSDKPLLIITHGLSASGKSTLTEPLIEKLSAIRIRSDVERKRLYGISVGSDAQNTDSQESYADFNQGIYDKEASNKTYQHLADMAEQVLDGGYSVIIDAAFLKFQQRQLFQQLAKNKKIPFIILEFTATPDTLRKRIKSRKEDISDADSTVLEQQLLHYKPIKDEERDHVITVDTESSEVIKNLVNRVKDYLSHSNTNT